MTRHSRRSIANRLEKAEAVRPGDDVDSLPPELAKVEESIVGDHGRDAFEEVLESVVFTMLEGISPVDKDPQRTEAGFVEPSPRGSDGSAWPTEAARDEAITELAHAWREGFADGEQREGAV